MKYTSRPTEPRVSRWLRNSSSTSSFAISACRAASVVMTWLDAFASRRKPPHSSWSPSQRTAMRRLDRQALAAGFDRHLTKPASLHDIRDILSSLPCGVSEAEQCESRPKSIQDMACAEPVTARFFTPCSGLKSASLRLIFDVLSKQPGREYNAPLQFPPRYGRCATSEPPGKKAGIVLALIWIRRSEAL